jgi:hypothetical protein
VKTRTEADAIISKLDDCAEEVSSDTHFCFTNASNQKLAKNSTQEHRHQFNETKIRGKLTYEKNVVVEEVNKTIHCNLQVYGDLFRRLKNFQHHPKI